MSDIQEVNFPLQYAEFARKTIEQGRRQICLFSPMLARDAYDDEDLAAAVSQLVRSHRRAMARILVGEDCTLRDHSHALIKLARQLPSLCQIRQLRAQPDRFNEDYLLVDRSGFARCSGVDADKAFFYGHAPARVAERQEHFDYYWQRGTESKELQIFSI